jgi:hypothetical protein
VADTKISALTGATAAALANEFAINEAGASKKVTLQQILDGVDVLGNAGTLADADKLLIVQSSVATDAALSALVTYLQTKGMPRVKQLTAQHSVSSTTATKVTDLDMTLEAGTYMFNYYLYEQSGTITVAPLFGFNFTGTATHAKWWFQYADLSSTLLAAIGTTAHDTSTATLGFQMAKAEDDFATTTPNMGPSATTNAVQTTATDILVAIKGLIVVSVSGNMELYHGSETANATSLEIGSSLKVIRTA